MERTEFCTLLSQCRKEKGIGKNEMCRLMGATFKEFQHIEDKPNNFSIDKPCWFLRAINYQLVLVSADKKYIINGIASVSKWLKESRANKYSQRAIAMEVGCTYVTVAHVESGVSKITIDLFLKLVDVLGYTIKVEPYE